MIEEGEKLVESDVLQDPKDIFLLHDDEIIAIAQGEERNWKDVVTERKAVIWRVKLLGLESLES